MPCGDGAALPGREQCAEKSARRHGRPAEKQQAPERRHDRPAEASDRPRDRRAVHGRRLAQRLRDERAQQDEIPAKIVRGDGRQRTCRRTSPSRVPAGPHPHQPPDAGPADQAGQRRRDRECVVADADRRDRHERAAECADRRADDAHLRALPRAPTEARQASAQRTTVALRASSMRSRRRTMKNDATYTNAIAIEPTPANQNTRSR